MKYLRLADGRQLAYRDAGGGRPLILLHGWGMSSHVFAELVAPLAASFRVLAPDLPATPPATPWQGPASASALPRRSPISPDFASGYAVAAPWQGPASPREGSGYTLEDLAADLLEWLTALDLRQAVLLGWSLGGQVALQLYPAAAPRVERLVLVAATPRFTAAADWSAGLPEGQVRAMERNLLRTFTATLEDFRRLQFAGEEIPSPRLEELLALCAGGGPPLPEAALATLETLRRSDLRSDLARIDCPVLVQQGTLDRITLPAAARYLADHLPQTRLVLQEAGHAPFLSRPGESLELWREFLR